MALCDCIVSMVSRIAVLPRPALAVRQPRKFAKICADRHRPRAVNVSGRLSRQSRVTVRIVRLTVKILSGH